MKDALRVRALFAEAMPVVEAALAAGLARSAQLPFNAAVTSAEAAAFAARIYKRGKVADKMPDPSAESESLCAPSFVHGQSDFFSYLRAREGAVILLDAGFAAARPEWLTACRSVAPDACLVIEDAEKAKCPEGLDALLARASALPQPWQRFVCVGGGALSDLGGFLAGLLDSPFEVVPTTYLAAVDAGQGGKTGINVPPFGKNQVGLFHKADAFHLVEGVFETLPEAERASGFGEALKHCYLYGAWPLARSDASLATLRMDTAFLLWNMRAKEIVVRADPREAHVRKLLNLGHTFGHAWEGLQEEGLVSRLPHGVCVALGIVLLARANLLEGAPPSFLESAAGLVSRFNPHALVPTQELESAFVRLVAADKKNASAAQVLLTLPRWGLLEAQGAAVSLANKEVFAPCLCARTPQECWALVQGAPEFQF